MKRKRTKPIQKPLHEIETDKLRKHKCLSVLVFDNIIVLDNLDQYKIKNNILVKMPNKSTIDFKLMYGDGIDTAKANWTNPYFPVYIEKTNKITWDY